MGYSLAARGDAMTRAPAMQMKVKPVSVILLPWKVRAWFERYKNNYTASTNDFDTEIALSTSAKASFYFKTVLKYLV
jgi:hypothetical protein